MLKREQLFSNLNEKDTREQNRGRFNARFKFRVDAGDVSLTERLHKRSKNLLSISPSLKLNQFL